MTAIRAPSQPEPWANAEIIEYEVSSLSVTEIVSRHEPAWAAERMREKMLHTLARTASQDNWLLGEPTISTVPWNDTGAGYVRITMVAPAVKDVRPEHLGFVESSLLLTPSRRTISAVQETWPSSAYSDTDVNPRYYAP